MGDDEQCMQRLDAQFAGHALTEQEREACRNCLRHSQHTRLRVMPNHHIDERGNLHGFLFTCSPEDMASVLPMNMQMFATTAVYEVKGERQSNFNADALRLVANLPASKQALRDVLAEIRADVCDEAQFDCIGEATEAFEGFAPTRIEDQRGWAESVPVKMGLYHAFSRSYANDQREHRLFIVVTGCLVKAAERLYNLWLDTGAHITCRAFVESEEVCWLRQATLRGLNRTAHRIAQRLELTVHSIVDIEDPRKGIMALPSLVTRHHDMDIHGQVRLVSSCTLTDRLDSGVVFDLFSSEGLWVFLGPRNTTEYSVFGSMFAHRACAQAFPTRTVRYNALYASDGLPNTVRVRAEHTMDIVLRDDFQDCAQPKEQGVLYNDFMIPDERFYKITEQLGFNRNDGILNLMPIVCFTSDEPLAGAGG